MTTRNARRIYFICITVLILMTVYTLLARAGAPLTVYLPLTSSSGPTELMSCPYPPPHEAVKVPPGSGEFEPVFVP